MEKENNRQYLWLIPLIVILTAIVVLLSVFIRLSREQASLPPYFYRLEELYSRRLTQPAAAENVSLVRYWMTFDYINRIFSLPPDYLASALNISDPHYPYITLSHYARGEKISPSQLLAEVQASVFNYLNRKR